MPILLLLQRGPWRDAAGSGIPQTMNALEDHSQLAPALAAPRTIQRGLLWTIATVALFPLGREGPVVHVGAAVARAIHKRFKRWLPSLNERQIVAIGGGAGLAGGFNTPLLAPIFMIEELTTEYSLTLIWPALVIGISAAWFSSIGGEPIFGLGMINVMAPESEQLLIAIPIGIPTITQSNIPISTIQVVIIHLSQYLGLRNPRKKVQKATIIVVLSLIHI